MLDMLGNMYETSCVTRADSKHIRQSMHTNSGELCSDLGVAFLSLTDELIAIDTNILESQCFAASYKLYIYSRLAKNPEIQFWYFGKQWIIPSDISECTLPKK